MNFILGQRLLMAITKCSMTMISYEGHISLNTYYILLFVLDANVVVQSCLLLILMAVNKNSETWMHILIRVRCIKMLACLRIISFPNVFQFSVHCAHTIRQFRCHGARAYLGVLTLTFKHSKFYIFVLTRSSLHPKGQ